MKRIMIVTNSLTGGGAERSMNLVANELHERKWEIALVPINSSPPDLVTPKCTVLPIGRTWNGGIINTIKALYNFNKTVISWKPDTVILNTDLPELFGALLVVHAKLIAVEHINRPWITRIHLGRIVRKILKKKGTSWIGVSAHLSIWPIGISPLKVIANPIASVVDSTIGRAEIGRNANILRLIFVGRLATQKRPQWLLEIARQEHLPIEFVGSGSMLNQLEIESEIVGLSVNFHGHLLEPWSIIREGDLLIVPSEYEGDGLVVIEAINLGLPILVADIPEFRRFGFPDRNYCKNIEAFTSSVNRYRNSLDELVLPQEIASQILRSRQISEIGNSWELLLLSSER
jgi:glycosyltransferase involved in cell wall biosynthesis